MSSDLMDKGIDLASINAGLIDDIARFRGGEMSIAEALTSAQMHKQLFKGIDLALRLQRQLAGAAKVVPSLPAPGDVQSGERC